MPMLKYLLFLFKVGDDRFADLHPAHIAFGNVANDIALADHIAIGEGHGSGNGVDFRNGEALVLLHFTGGDSRGCRPRPARGISRLMDFL